MRHLPLIAVMVFACSTALATDWATDAHRYRVDHRFSLPGDGFWDLLTVDETSGRVFLSHGTMVQVMDAKTGAILGVIPNTNGVHGITLAQPLNKGFVACGKDNSIVVFNLATLAVEARISVAGKNPDAIIYEPSTQRVFSFNGHSANATVIDGKSDTIIGTVTLGGKPELSATDGHGTVFVNLEDKNRVAVIDAKTMKVTHAWPVASAEGPTGLAIDAKSHHLFVGGNNKIMAVVDAANGRLIETLPIGEHVDGVAFDPGLKRVYSANGDGTLTVIQQKTDYTYSVLDIVSTEKGARTLAVNTKTHHVFLPTAKFGDTPKATEDNPHPRPAIKPASFVVLDVGVHK